MKFSVSELTLYKLRYKIGAVIVFLAFLIIIGLRLFYGSQTLSIDEMRSAIISDRLAGFTNLIDLPYRIIQKLLIDTFGLSPVTIKLPSTIFAIISIICLIIISKLWTNTRTAILSCFAAISTSRLMFFMQDGTPKIMIIFWSALILLIIHYLIEFFKLKDYKDKTKVLNYLLIVASPLISLSLYTPLTIYIIGIITISVLAHPHIRFIAKKSIRLADNKYIAVSVLAGVATILPLIISLTKNPTLGWELLGLSGGFNPLENLQSLLFSYFGFGISINQSFIPTPIFNFSSMIIVLLGLYVAIKQRQHYSKTIVLTWFVVSILIGVLTPYASLLAFLPTYVLFAIGIHYLISSWYKIFPYNPYARIAGLIPITLVILSLVISGIDIFTYSYRHNPEIAGLFRKDLVLINEELRDKSETIIVVDTPLELDFYKILTAKNPNLSVTDKVTIGSGPKQIVSRSVHRQFNIISIDRILVDGFMKEGDRFYVYKKYSN